MASFPAPTERANVGGRYEVIQEGGQPHELALLKVFAVHFSQPDRAELNRSGIFKRTTTVRNEDMTRLASMLTAFEQKNDLTAGDVANDIGINESTYCRIKKGKMPDARNMAKIITWMIQQPPPQ